MVVTHLEINSVRSFANGKSFGEVGTYELLEGKIHFAVSPNHPFNRKIVDIDKVNLDVNYNVHFWSDFCLLRPVSIKYANRCLLFEVPNRGQKLIFRLFNRATRQANFADPLAPGDGFLLKRGWQIAWCGWQWDVIRDSNRMGIEVPSSLDKSGHSIKGKVSYQFQPEQYTQEHSLADTNHIPYKPIDINQSDALLVVRKFPGGSGTIIPRSNWRFVRILDDSPVEANTHVWSQDGFLPGYTYEVIYNTQDCPVVGTGLLAVRDTVSFLRYGIHGFNNPCSGKIDYTFGFGMSQSARFLRHFLYLGLNIDEGKRIVFDGIFSHGAGARRGEFNHRFAQPSAIIPFSCGHIMPYSDTEQTDVHLGKTDSILSRQRKLGGIPKIFTTNNSTEYFYASSSLTHTDLDEGDDLEPPEEVRIYLFAGTQHSLDTLPLSNRQNGYLSGANPFNIIDYTPLLRAALNNLLLWVINGEDPPPSVFPRRADGTAVNAKDILKAFRYIPGIHLPNVKYLPMTYRRNFLAETELEITQYPRTVNKHYKTWVSNIDSFYNELAGIRLPDLTVPLATYTGWNTRHLETGGIGQVIPAKGSTIPLPSTTDIRKKNNDPRPAIDELYLNLESYIIKFSEEAQKLVELRYVDSHDVPEMVNLAIEKYRVFLQNK